MRLFTIALTQSSGYGGISAFCLLNQPPRVRDVASYASPPQRLRLIPDAFNRGLAEFRPSHPPVNWLQTLDRLEEPLLTFSGERHNLTVLLVALRRGHLIACRAADLFFHHSSPPL